MDLPELTSRATIEADVESVVSRYHREQQGTAPTMIRASLVRDMIYVRSTGVFTRTERQLFQSDEGRKLVMSARRELRSLTRRHIETEVAKTVGVAVVRSYWDMDARVGEQLEAYVFEEDLEERLRRNDR